MSEPKLLPCPFCGAFEEPYYLNVAVDWPEENYYSVVCESCDCSGPNTNTSDEARSQWNRRVPDWIPVSERLPKEENCYPVVRKILNDVSVLCLNYYKDNNSWQGNYGAVAGVTHTSICSNYLFKFNMDRTLLGFIVKT